jgi:predicted aspartyl protease
MTTATLQQPKGRERLVGQVFETLTVSNRADQILERNGYITPNRVRNLVLDEVLVDTGATTICLPAEMVEQLGLELHRTVSLETATGKVQARVFNDLWLSVLGREGTFICVELPTGSRPLLGCVPMEALGLEPDLVNHRLRVLPDQGENTYLMALGVQFGS